jgi:hypothetical protein
MQTTIFLAQIWGPVILAVGVGMFISREYYIKIYRDLDKETTASLLFGMVLMAVGIVSILFHNTWGTLPEFLISLMGWGALLKGVFFIVTPSTVDRMGEYWVSKNCLNISAIAAIAIGFYLTYISYLV